MYEHRSFIKPTHGEGLVSTERAEEAEALIEAMQQVQGPTPCPSVRITAIGIEASGVTPTPLHERIVASGRNREAQTEWYLDVSPEQAACPPPSDQHQ